MKRGLMVFLLAVVVGLTAFALRRGYEAGRQATGIWLDSMPELAWIRNDLELSDEQFQEISALHRAYRPKCGDMCGRLTAAQERLEALAKGGARMTPELERALEEHAMLQMECRRAMMEHFYETAGHLRPDQAARYLETMLPHALGTDHEQPGVTGAR
jgi:predicted nuclease with TOPRIM domain